MNLSRKWPQPAAGEPALSVRPDGAGGIGEGFLEIGSRDFMEMKESVPAVDEAVGIESFGTIVETYRSQVMALAVNILRNKEDAEDAAQDAFIQVFRHLADYDAERSFKTWIFTIVHRRCLDVLRKKKRFRLAFDRMKRDLDDSVRNPHGIPASENGLPADLLGNLSPKERSALSLWANEGFTSREISEVLGCSEGTARVHLFAARKKIKTLLEKRHAALSNL
jgi:RNA polymerase sigma factor (sigma-70 family)